MALKERWGSGLGFVLAAAGSAVGLGNLWGFAYRASQGGGGAFVLLYVVIVLFVCLPLLIAEMSLGRSTGKSPLLAPVSGGKVWYVLGWLFLIVSSGILSYYVVVMGYAGTTLLAAIYGDLPKDITSANDYFSSISSGSVSLKGQLCSLLLTGIVVSAGIKAGIERLAKWGVPILLFLLIILGVWVFFQPDSKEGYQFLFGWDSTKLFDRQTVSNAFKQAFFSVGTGIGAILAYSIYLDKKSKIPGEAAAVVTLDTAVGLIAGCVTFPLVATLGISEFVGSGSIGTLFIAMPHGLASPLLGDIGWLVSILFFSLVYIAAITSAVSLLEVPVSSLMDLMGLRRSIAVAISLVIITIIGIPSALDINYLAKMDSYMNLLLISSGLLLAILMGWILPGKLRTDLQEGGSENQFSHVIISFLRWVTIPAIALGLAVVFEETFKHSDLDFLINLLNGSYILERLIEYFQ